MIDTEWERALEEHIDWHEHLKEVDAILASVETAVEAAGVEIVLPTNNIVPYNTDVVDLRCPDDTEGLGTHYIVYNNPNPPPKVEWKAYMDIGCGWGRLEKGQPLVHAAGPGCPGEAECYRSIWG